MGFLTDNETDFRRKMARKCRGSCVVAASALERWLEIDALGWRSSTLETTLAENKVLIEDLERQVRCWPLLLFLPNSSVSLSFRSFTQSFPHHIFPHSRVLMDFVLQDRCGVTSLIKNTHPPWDYRRTLRTVFLQGPRGGGVL